MLRILGGVIMIKGVYYETWLWYNEKNQLKNVDPEYNTVYLSFADPNGKWNGQDLSGTGLGFGVGIDQVKQQIWDLKNRGVKVMLSVGGATFLYPDNFDGYEMVRLADGLGCDGIDIDWEPFNGKMNQWDGIIQSFHDRIEQTRGSCKLLSAAVWSTGCMQPREGDTYRGINISGLVNKGSYLNWLNIMAYDCGPPSSIDPKGCFYTYRIYYTGPLCMGFEVGKMGWGNYLTTQDDVKDAAAYVGKDVLGNKNGYFIWSSMKTDYANGVDHKFIRDTCKMLIEGQNGGGGGECIPLTEMKCPWCMNKVKLIKD